METFNDMFRIIQNPENEKYYVAVGNQLVTKEKFDSEEDATTYLEEKPYEVIMNLMAIVIKYELLHHNNSNYKAGKWEKNDQQEPQSILQ